jgi:hypothetical protein
MALVFLAGEVGPCEFKFLVSSHPTSSFSGSFWLDDSRSCCCSLVALWVVGVCGGVCSVTVFSNSSSSTPDIMSKEPSHGLFAFVLSDRGNFEHASHMSESSHVFLQPTEVLLAPKFLLGVAFPLPSLSELVETILKVRRVDGVIAGGDRS